MRTIYQHESSDGRTAVIQTASEPDEPKLRMILDAPGERAVSHEWDAATPADSAALADLLGALFAIIPTTGVDWDRPAPDDTEDLPPEPDLDPPFGRIELPGLPPDAALDPPPAMDDEPPEATTQPA